MSNETFIVITLCLAVMRIYLELIKFDFERLPITKSVANKFGSYGMKGFHRTGLIFSVGYVLLFAPQILFS